MIARDVATGCGCGGHGCGCGCGGVYGGCGCQRPARSTVPQPGTFVRPRFFAGQLLTEEDLEALVTYTLGKERLHNRYLVGSGVICGLDVACVPGLPGLPGSVQVRSGYALDCCGNDIVVACDQTLDINALIADLPGDASCLEPPPPSRSGHGGKASPAGRTTMQTLRRQFELVVEYAETPGGMVAPFSTGEETTAACEPSRVHEGYRFSLRCPPTTPPPQPPSLLEALRCCLELADGAEQHLPRLKRALELANKIVDTDGDPVPDPRSSEEVDHAVEQLSRDPDLDLAVRVAAQGARLALAAPTEERDRTDEAHRDFDAEAQKAFAAVDAKLGALRQAAGTDPLAAGQVAALEERVSSLSQRSTGKLTATRADQLLAHEVPVSDRLREAIRTVVADTRNWTLCRGPDSPAHHCADIRDLSRLGADPADDASLRDAARTALRAAEHLILDCVCSAINPPCLPCDDPAVPLAVLTVAGCEVVDICTLVRRHPVTGTALRYWLPLDCLHALIERLCCGEYDPIRLLRELSLLLSGCGLEVVKRVGQPSERGEQVAGQEAGVAAREAHVTAADGDQGSPVPPASEGTPGVDAKLLRMLNSQVQHMRARINRLEVAMQGQAHDG